MDHEQIHTPGYYDGEASCCQASAFIKAIVGNKFLTGGVVINKAIPSFAVNPLRKDPLLRCGIIERAKTAFIVLKRRFRNSFVWFFGLSFGLPHLFGHFFGLDPIRVPIHECPIAAVVVAGMGHSSLSIGAGRQVPWQPDVELAPAAQSTLFSDNWTP